MRSFIKPISAIYLSGLLLSACQLSAESPIEANTTSSSLKQTLQSAQNGHYTVPNLTEIESAERLFIRSLQSERSQALETAWQNKGFTMRTVTVANSAFTVIQEHKNKRTGRGLYVFRQTGGLPILLQAPHSFKDLYTGQIVRRLLLEKNYKAAAWNTVSRNEGDMAHLDNTIFQAFGRAFAKVYSTGTIIQWHGFAQHKRQTENGRTADIILSPTTQKPSKRIFNLSQCLKSQLTDFVVRIYPFEVNELGGTKNSNAIDLRQRGFNSFIHIELSKPLRKKLRHNQAVRQKLIACL
jgi:hypothetical protein